SAQFYKDKTLTLLVKHARLGIGIAAGRVVDEQREGLVFVELGGGGSGRENDCGDKRETRQHGKSPTPQSSPTAPPDRRICSPRSPPASRAAPSGSRCRSS